MSILSLEGEIYKEYYNITQNRLRRDKDGHVARKEVRTSKIMLGVTGLAGIVMSAVGVFRGSESSEFDPFMNYVLTGAIGLAVHSYQFGKLNENASNKIIGIDYEPDSKIKQRELIGMYIHRASALLVYGSICAMTYTIAAKSNSFFMGAMSGLLMATWAVVYRYNILEGYKGMYKGMSDFIRDEKRVVSLNK